MRGFGNGTAFYQHIVNLTGDIESKVHNSARRAIRKAEKAGVTVRVSSELADTRRFYELMVQTRRKHGLLPQPWRFFTGQQRRDSPGDCLQRQVRRLVGQQLPAAVGEHRAHGLGQPGGSAACAAGVKLRADQDGLDGRQMAQSVGGAGRHANILYVIA